MKSIGLEGLLDLLQTGIPHGNQALIGGKICLFSEESGPYAPLFQYNGNATLIGGNNNTYTIHEGGSDFFSEKMSSSKSGFSLCFQQRDRPKISIPQIIPGKSIEIPVTLGPKIAPGTLYIGEIKYIWY